MYYCRVPDARINVSECKKVITTYRGIVEDKGIRCIDRWFTGICGRIDNLRGSVVSQIRDL